MLIASNHTPTAYGTATVLFVNTDVNWPFRDFADRLERDMKRAGIANFSQLASKAHVDRSSFSRYTTGQAQPTVETVSKLATALEVSLIPYLLDSGRITADELDAPSIPAIYGELVELDAELERDSPADQEHLRLHVEVLMDATRKRRGRGQ